MRLQELETLALRTELKQNAEAVFTRAEQDIEAARAALQNAGETLGAARAKREASYQKLAALNHELKVISAALADSKQLALANDQPVVWREAAKNRERRSQLRDLAAFQTLWIFPEDSVAMLEAEIAVEEARNDLLEAQCAKDRAAVYALAIKVRGIDAGAEISLEDSASARVLKTVNRSRLEIIPSMMDNLQKLREKRVLGQAEAQKVLFS